MSMNAITDDLDHSAFPGGASVYSRDPARQVAQSLRYCLRGNISAIRGRRRWVSARAGASAMSRDIAVTLNLTGFGVVFLEGPGGCYSRVRLAR
jgi:hypothetical protein